MPLSDISTAMKVRARQTKQFDLVASSADFTFEKGLTFDIGAGLNQADRLFHDKDQIAASGTKDWDLNGVLLDIYGDAFNLLRVKGLYIFAYQTNTNNIIIGNHATAAWASWVGAATHTVILKPGGKFMLEAPDAPAYAVTATTADILRLTNSAGGSVVDYEIAILGSST